MKHLVAVIMATLLVGFAAGAAAAKRVALVIGNSAYQHTPTLANPANDAADMAAKLQSLGFDVLGGEDLTLDQLRSEVRSFADRLEGADIGLFFYAGHGLEVDGENYILPVDARLSAADDLRYETMPMRFVQLVMERKAQTALIFLDACRDNPLARSLARTLGARSSSIGRGLAQMGASVGTLIAYATQPGNVALDGEGRNSPFTSALLRHIGTPGEDLTVSMRKVRADVLEDTGGAQVPWENSSLTGAVILKALEKIRESVDKVGEELAEDRDAEVEIAFWTSIRDSADASYYETYLAEYPEGRFAPIARLRIAELQAAGVEEEAPPEEVAMAAPPQVEEVPAAPAPPVRAAQAKLNALGCEAGPVDGVWGRRSAAALARFEAATGARLAERRPSPAMVAALSAFSGRVCPLVCGDGFEERGGACVKVAAPERQVSEPERQAAASEGGGGRFDGLWKYTRTTRPGKNCGFDIKESRISVRNGWHASANMVKNRKLTATFSDSGEVLIAHQGEVNGILRRSRTIAMVSLDANGHASGTGEYAGEGRGCVASVKLERFDGKHKAGTTGPSFAPKGYDGNYQVEIVRSDGVLIGVMRLKRVGGALELSSARNGGHGSAEMSRSFSGSLDDGGRLRFTVTLSYLNGKYRPETIHSSRQLPRPFAVGMTVRYEGSWLGREYGSYISVRRLR